MAQLIHATKVAAEMGLVTEMGISVSNNLRVVLPIGRRHSAQSYAQMHVHDGMVTAQPENFYTRRNSQSSAIPTHPITWLLLSLLWLLGSLARTRTQILSNCPSYLITEYGQL